MDDYLKGLNEPQLQAVQALDGAVLMLAGAGTGKTRALTARLAHIIKTGKAWPSQILAVTFTNKAALEMRERVEKIVGGDAPSWLGTFHALCTRMLRSDAQKIDGLSSNFTILDTSDQTRLIKQIMQTLEIDIKKTLPKNITNQISRLKDGGVAPDGVRDDDQLQAIYSAYQKRLLALNSCDFGDLLLHTTNLLKENPDILSIYHNKFKYILVDEYQDTNSVQYDWLKALASGGANICCVGDDDQSIYGWRGAEIGNILKFEQDFQGAQVIRLEQNYRSTGHILGAAGALINRNQSRLGKTLWSAGENGHKVKVCELWDGDGEARWVARKIDKLRQRGENFDQMAVLVRAGFQTRSFEEAFLRQGLPYKIIGGLRFYERAEIRDIIAYLRVVAQSADDLALERIINTPKRGIGDRILGTLHAFAREKSLSLHDTCLTIIDTPSALRPSAKMQISNLMTNFAKWREAAKLDTPPSELVEQILDKSGYLEMAKADKTPQGPARVENLKELLISLEEFDTLEGFLEHVALVTDGETKGNLEKSISIMTLHGSKGLEFDNVFLTGWEEGLFPSARTIEESGNKGIEEERRLAYVGLTRARLRAFVLHAQQRRVYGKWVHCIPSRFIGDLPEEHAERQGQSCANVCHNSVNDVSLSRGARVCHPTFGNGTVTHFEGQKVDIAFDDGSQRRVMASFVEEIAA